MGDVADKIRGFKAGGSDFLVKPYEPSELIARVSTQISLRRAQHELACRNQDLKEEIRDREKAHAALLDSESRNEAVLNNAAVCIGLLSLDGTYEMVNGLYAEVFGYSRTEFQNMRLQDIMHPDYIVATEEFMEFLRYGQLEQHYADKKFIRKDGSVFPGGHWLSPRRTGYGTCNGFVCIISDLTEQKKLKTSCGSRIRSLRPVQKACWSLMLKIVLLWSILLLLQLPVMSVIRRLEEILLSSSRIDRMKSFTDRCGRSCCGRTVGRERSGIDVVTVKNIPNGSQLRLYVIGIGVLLIMLRYFPISVIGRKLRRFCGIRQCMTR